jgi:dUTP pyrophosphatase
MTSGPGGSRPETVRVLLMRLGHADGLPLPAYQTAHAAGADLLAALPDGEPHVLEPGARALIPTGIAIALPESFEAQVRPRSGLALRHGVTVLNAPGTIDADYRGEVQVLLINLGAEPFFIRRGDRIAQLVVSRVARVDWIEAVSLDETQRGPDGFGSTGVSHTG